MSRLALALDGISFARQFTLERLAALPAEDWYRQPAGGVTHVAWQVGHLAMAEYRLCLERIRGPRAEDEQLISRDFLTRYGRGSVPSHDATPAPPPDELLSVLSRVHEQAQQSCKALPRQSSTRRC